MMHQNIEREHDYCSRNETFSRVLKVIHVVELHNYVFKRLPLGKFLSAIVCGNICEASKIAVRENICNVDEVFLYVSMRVPSDAWGSPEAYYRWLDKKVA